MKGLPFNSFSLARLIIIPSKPKFISGLTNVLFTTYFTTQKTDQTSVITMKTVIYPILPTINRTSESANFLNSVAE